MMQAAFQKVEEDLRQMDPESQTEVIKELPKEPLDVGLEAARQGDEECLRELLESGWSISTPDKYGGTALHWAAGGGHLACCKVHHHIAWVLSS